MCYIMIFQNIQTLVTLHWFHSCLQDSQIPKYSSIRIFIAQLLKQRLGVESKDYVAMAPHSGILAWKLPLTEEPGGLQSMGSGKSDTTERLHFHFLLSCIGEGNGNPLQCSCLENPMDRGAWWAAVHGVAKSRTRLKRLSSSSSSMLKCWPL